MGNSKKANDASSEQNETEGNDIIPDDAFSGDFKEEKHKNGSSYTFKDDTGVLTTEGGNKVMWTHDENGNLVIVSPNDGKYEVDPDDVKVHLRMRVDGEDPIDDTPCYEEFNLNGVKN